MKTPAGLRLGSWVRVTWFDASSHDEGWATADELTNKLQRCVTVGIVAQKDRKQVLLAMSYGDYPSDPDALPQYCTTMAIPLGWIKSVEVWP